MKRCTTPVYLDYAASTPVDPRVLSKIQETLQEFFANPSSLHFYGRKALEIVESARSQVAAAIGASPAEIVFTSGATEADNLALKGAAALYARKGRHLITVKTEHKAVLDACQHLEKNGFKVTYLSPQRNGLVDLNELQEALTDETILVSIMHVNNETGIVQDISKIAQMTSQQGILFHVDAAQSIGKAILDVNKTPIDLLSLCAHKSYGPKGIGALFIRRKPRVRVQPLLHGGGHEQGMRSGTLAPHQIAGMGLAFEIASAEQKVDVLHIRNMRDLFLQELVSLPHFRVNCESTDCVPHILNVRFEHMLADAVLAKLPDIAASTASACQGNAREGSHVLKAMGFGLEKVQASIRFSFGRFTTEEEIKRATQLIKNLFV